MAEIIGQRKVGGGDESHEDEQGRQIVGTPRTGETQIVGVPRTGGRIVGEVSRRARSAAERELEKPREQSGMTPNELMQLTDEELEQLAIDVSQPAVLSTDDKSRLIGVPFFIIEKTMRRGDSGPYVSIVCRLKGTGELVVINDGSTGIMRQLEGIDIPSDNTPALHVRGGLRRSEYTTIVDNRPQPAETYYLDGAPQVHELKGLGARR